MATAVDAWSVCSNIVLCAIALFSSHQLFKPTYDSLKYMNHDMEEKGVVAGERLQLEPSFPLLSDHRLGAAHCRRRWCLSARQRGSGGRQPRSTIPFSSILWFSLLQIDVDVEELETSANPTQSFEIHNIVWRLPQLLADHRAPSVAFFLLGFSAIQCTLSPFCVHLAYLQHEMEWASEILVSSLIAFDFLWLSEDCNTAHILLCGSCLFLGLSDCLSADTLNLMTHCLGLSSLSCSMTVCLFSSNGWGTIGSLALSLPSLVGLRIGVHFLSPLLSPVASEGLVKLILKGSLSLGCWATRRGLDHFLLEVRTWD